MITGLQARQQVIDNSMAILYQAVDANEKEIVGLQLQLAEAQKRIAQLEAELEIAKVTPINAAPPPNFAGSDKAPAKANGKEK